MPLGKEVDLGPRDIVLDGDPPSPRKGSHGHISHPLFGACLLWPNGRPSQQLPSSYTLCSKSDAKIEITITMTNLVRIKYPLSSFNYRLSGANVANFNRIHHTVSEQQLFRKWNSKTEVSDVEKSP